MFERIKKWFGAAEAQPEPRIVAAVLTVAASYDKPLAQAVEDAMAASVMDYLARGGSMDDVPALRDVQMQARNRVLGRS
jgi:hypothetical protein